MQAFAVDQNLLIQAFAVDQNLLIQAFAVDQNLLMSTFAVIQNLLMQGFAVDQNLVMSTLAEVLLFVSSAYCCFAVMLYFQFCLQFLEPSFGTFYWARASDMSMSAHVQSDG